MDVQAFKTDLLTALRRLPPNMLKTLAENIVSNREALMREVPKMVDELKPHVRVLAFELASGLVDWKQELLPILFEILVEFKVDLPPEVLAEL
jgi:hypothetical protein